MITRSRLLAVATIALAGVLTLLKVPLASSQGITLFAAFVPGELPAAVPDSPVWQRTTAVEVPLSAQQVAVPHLTRGTIQSVRARVLHNGAQLALLVEWADDSRDDAMVRIQDFRDSVAVQFPLVEGQPFFCMGQAGGNVNIWHWKADWQADIAARQDMDTVYPDMYVDLYPFTDAGLGALAGPGDYTDPNYLPALASGNLLASITRTSPVEDLVAGGFGTLTSQPADGQNVSGFGSWQDGRWQVIFVRDLSSQEEHDAVFVSDQVYPIAFAVWDGSNGERDGQKSTSQWLSLRFEPAVAERPAKAQPALTAASKEPFIFVLAPMAATLVLLALAVGGVYVVGSLMARKR